MNFSEYVNAVKYAREYSATVYDDLVTRFNECMDAIDELSVQINDALRASDDIYDRSYDYIEHIAAPDADLDESATDQQFTRANNMYTDMRRITSRYEELYADLKYIQKKIDSIRTDRADYIDD